MDWTYWLNFIPFVAAILLAITTLLLLILEDWRIALAVLAIQYVAVFLLVVQYWRLEMAIVKLVAGWIACSILGMAIASLPEGLSSQRSGQAKSSFLFSQKLFAGARSGKMVAVFSTLLVWLMVFTYAVNLPRVFPNLDLYTSISCLLLIGVGLLQLGFSSRPLPTFLALLTILSGFEILYASVEASILMTGLLAAVNLSLALVGAYLILSPAMGETE
jgi:hypothetical protein